MMFYCRRTDRCGEGMRENVNTSGFLVLKKHYIQRVLKMVGEFQNSIKNTISKEFCRQTAILADKKGKN